MQSYAEILRTKVVVWTSVNEEPTPRENLDAAVFSARDPYAVRLRRVWECLCHPEYPAGMILWLGDACPILYTELTERLPDKIQRLWEARAPLDEFERVLDLWKEAHRTGCRIYRQHLVAEKRLKSGETRRTN